MCPTCAPQLRYVPADGSYQNGEVVDFLDNDDEGFRMPLQLLPPGIPIAELRNNNVKWKEYVVDPSTDYDATEYEASKLCSCMGPTNSWTTCPHAGLAHLMAKLDVDAVCHPWCRSSVLYKEQLQVDEVGYS